MSVLLRSSRDLPPPSAYGTWVAVPPLRRQSQGLDPQRIRSGVSGALEDAFNQETQVWWRLCQTLARTRGARLAHTPAAAANISDLGVMLAWSRLARFWAAEPETTLLICDDPWLFRHLRTMPGISPGRSPQLFLRAMALWTRGYAARTHAALRLAMASVRLRTERNLPFADRPAILVYGHPASTLTGIDGYFGELPREMPEIVRVLHVDCRPDRAEQLVADGRTVSLHAFGNPFFAALLPFVRWHPGRIPEAEPYAWLIRRAATLEGGGGQAATIRWQIHCQERWLRRFRPRAVAWPWENHAWERAFAPSARRLGVRTIGYQHSVVGHQLNFGFASNANPDELPDRIFCNSVATRDQLQAWGHPSDRLAVAGALRFQGRAVPAASPDAPVFVALPFDGAIADQMVSAVQKIAATTGRQFVVKDHPMSPFRVSATANVKATEMPLERHERVSAVIYAATTVGFEAAIGGLPTLRFRPRDRVALDILPDGVTLPTADADTLADALRLGPPPRIPAQCAFAPVNKALWREALA